MIQIRNGLDVPIDGAPETSVETGPPVRRVALVADDYIGMKPTMAVQEGDSVLLGQTLFEDKKTPGVLHTSPGAGRVAAVVRGAKRKFEAIVIELEGDGEETFASYRPEEIPGLEREAVQQNLVNSGLWTALRTRPYSRVPAPGTAPASVFVTAMETRPLAPDPAPIIQERAQDFVNGLQALARLTDGSVFLCHRRGVTPPGRDLPAVKAAEFDGPHPAGLPGTHIHFLDPVREGRFVWHVAAQDVIAIGQLFTTGRLQVERTIALGGPGVERPRLLRTRLGASIEDLTREQLRPGTQRCLSGSVLGGRQATGPQAFLGRYHHQVSALPEAEGRALLGWLAPGRDKFSVTRAFLSALTGRTRRFPFSTTSGGDPRPIVPIGSYERVMPLDVVATVLLKALVVGDTERAQLLGCLELDEEDLELCSFVCPGKGSYGPHLRDVLTRIEKEG